jgi:hypothetical protein
MSRRAKGDLKAYYSATVTGRYLNDVAEELEGMGYRSGNATYRDSDKPPFELISFEIQDYDPAIAHVVLGIFGIKGWLYGRSIKLNTPVYKAA